MLRSDRHLDVGPTGLGSLFCPLSAFTDNTLYLVRITSKAIPTSAIVPQDLLLKNPSGRLTMASNEVL